MLAFMFASVAFALDYLEPDIRIESPDKHWVVWVVKHHNKDDYTAQLFISATNSSNSVVLAENDRHFGCEWSPESKVLLIYDNCGSGTSDTIIYRYTPDGWRKIYQTPGGFHIIWRLDEWLPDGVRLRAHFGGSEPSKVPETVTIKYDAIKPKAP